MRRATCCTRWAGVEHWRLISDLLVAVMQPSCKSPCSKDTKHTEVRWATNIFYKGSCNAVSLQRSSSCSRGHGGGLLPTRIRFRGSLQNILKSGYAQQDKRRGKRGENDEQMFEVYTFTAAAGAASHRRPPITPRMIFAREKLGAWLTAATLRRTCYI